jgi:hypothetical protein
MQLQNERACTELKYFQRKVHENNEQIMAQTMQQTSRERRATHAEHRSEEKNQQTESSNRYDMSACITKLAQKLPH